MRSKFFVQRNEVWKVSSQVCVQRNKVLKLRKKFVFRVTRLEAENPGGVLESLMFGSENARLVKKIMVSGSKKLEFVSEKTWNLVPSKKDEI